VATHTLDRIYPMRRIGIRIEIDLTT